MANQILLEIQRGVRLKKAQCNDRSRPNLNGLGVFRRQLSTVDVPDQLQQDAIPSPLIEPEEDYDDIDKVRDDLQSTKQLLEIELKNRIKIDTENARLQNEIRRLKEELSKKPQAQQSSSSFVTASAPPPVPIQSAAPLRKSSSSLNHGLAKSTSRMLLAARKAKKAAAGSDDDEDDSDEEMDFGELEAVEEELNALRGQAELARKTAEEFELRYKETSQKLVTTQAEMEDLEMKVTVLQKKLRRAQAGNGIEEAETTDFGTQTDPMKMPTPPPQMPMRSYSKRDIRRQMSRQDSRASNLSSTGGGGESGEEDEDGEDEDPLKAQKRELKMLLSRLRAAKDKEKATANERVAMKQQLRKFRSDLKDEKKKYLLN